MGNEERLTQGITMQIMGNEARKTHCSHKKLQCQQMPTMSNDSFSLFTQGVT
ncbi:hypothetical protein KSS87_011770, partial [Heliosperma pusillum]